ncbi:Uncharacterised protein [Streptobacillus moniliformis]|nr:Uncharacterised protein [Streptobacillus moniliformis]
MRKNFIVDENKTSRNKEKLSLGIERYVAISEALNIWKRAFIGMSIMTISFACLSTFLFINKSETKSYLIKVIITENLLVQKNYQIKLQI